ncbi:MAG: hypothetical protein GXN92_03125 [Candidatus Micrarchaeota archaeon]|nr:hypothetical protein [Candidatus Micrarchaeota archaeon]
MRLGVVVFILAVALSLLIGVLSLLNISVEALQFGMVVLGILAGYLNITKEEKMEFLVAGIAFIVSLQVVLASSAYLSNLVPPLFLFLSGSLVSLMVFSAGALAYVAIRSVIDLIRD